MLNISINGPEPTHRPIFGRKMSFSDWLADNAPGFKPLSDCEEATLIGEATFGSLRGNRTSREKAKVTNLFTRKERQTACEAVYKKDCPLVVVGYRKLDLSNEADAAYRRARTRRWNTKTLIKDQV